MEWLYGELKSNAEVKFFDLVKAVRCCKLRDEVVKWRRILL
jgi:hypothetical protein